MFSHWINEVHRRYPSNRLSSIFIEMEEAAERLEKTVVKQESSVFCECKSFAVERERVEPQERNERIFERFTVTAEDAYYRKETYYG